MVDVIWDLEDDPDGNVQHIAEHGVTPEEVEEVLNDPESQTGRSVKWPTHHLRLYGRETPVGGGLGDCRAASPWSSIPSPPTSLRGAENMAKRMHRKIERTPEERRKLKEVRERFQRERPTLEQLRASGDVTEVVAQGEYVGLLKMLAALKRQREGRGLSLADVAAKSGMDRAAVSRLENGVYLNPTLDTIYRYAAAVGAEIGFTVRTS